MEFYKTFTITVVGLLFLSLFIRHHKPSRNIRESYNKHPCPFNRQKKAPPGIKKIKTQRNRGMLLV